MKKEGFCHPLRGGGKLQSGLQAVSGVGSHPWELLYRRARRGLGVSLRQHCLPSKSHSIQVGESIWLGT